MSSYANKLLVKPIITVLVLLWIVHSSACLTTEGNPFRCYFKTASGSVTNDKDVCSISYSGEGCHQTKKSSAIVRLTTKAKIESVKANITSSFVKIVVPFDESGSPVLSINGVDEHGSQRCVTITFRHIDAGSPVELHMDQLKLPTGSFHLTGYHGRANNFSGMFVHKDFRLQHNRLRRSYPCRMSQCTLYKPEFTSDGGIFRFHYLLQEDPICENEEDNKVILYKLEDDPMTEQRCKSFNQTSNPNVLMKVVRSSDPRELDKEVIEFRNTEEGCYTIRAGPACFLGFLWFNSTNVVNMKNWNTSILIVPREREKSLQVTWKLPEYPYNFTQWELTMWTIKDFPVSCIGNNPKNKSLTTFAPRKVIDTNTYSYFDLTDGYYCIRLAALDPRCPENDCGLRASQPAHFNSSRVKYIQPEGVGLNLKMILLVVACLVIGTGFAILFYRHKLNKSVRRLPYELVAEKSKPLNAVKTLVIWTEFTPQNSPPVKEVVSAFKELLQRYSGCQVMDYLDPSKLSNEQCADLLSDPTAWINTQLKQADVKIIFIVSEGAVVRQNLHSNVQDNDVVVIEEINNGFDKSLYPYVLHFLKESITLSSDYSRIFPVCFPDLCKQIVGLEGLVSSVRYNIPSHLKDLTMRLHGLAPDAGRSLQDPSRQMLSRLTDAISEASSTVETCEPDVNTGLV